MADIGIRELKARASEVVRRVAEEQATYTITRRGRAVGVLAPAGSHPAEPPAGGDVAWDRLLNLMEEYDGAVRAKRSRSALKELSAMRR